MRYPSILRSLLCATALLLAGVGVPAHAQAATCFDAAAERYNLPVALLHAVARVESGGDPRAENRNKNGTTDIGVMQINSAWLPTLATHGITRARLFDACTNIGVGAWILAGNVARLGWNWTAIGAYNAGDPAKRAAYARKIWSALSPALSPAYGRPAAAADRPLPRLAALTSSMPPPIETIAITANAM